MNPDGLVRLVIGVIVLVAAMLNMDITRSSGRGKRSQFSPLVRKANRWIAAGVGLVLCISGVISLVSSNRGGASGVAAVPSSNSSAAAAAPAAGDPTEAPTSANDTARPSPSPSETSSAGPPGNRMTLDDYLADAENELQQLQDYAQEVTSTLSGIQSSGDLSQANRTLGTPSWQPRAMRSSGPTPVLYLQAGEGERFRSERERLAAAFRQTGLDLGNTLRTELERIAAIPGTEVQLGLFTRNVVQSIQTNIERIQGDSMNWISVHEDVSPETHITVEVSQTGNGDVHDRFPAKLAKAYPAGHLSGGQHEINKQIFYLSPVTDIQELANKIDFAKVDVVDADTNTLRLTLDQLSVDKLLAEKAAEEQATREAQSADVRGRLQEAVAAAEKLQSLLAQVRSAAEIYKARGQLDDAADAWWRISERNQELLTSVLLDDAQKALLAQEWPAARDKAHASLEQEFAKLRQDPQALVELKLACGESVAEAGAFARAKEKHVEPGENPKHPDFWIANLNRVQFYGSFERDDALEQLGKVRPRDLTDAELRKKIARALRDLVLSEDEQQSPSPAAAYRALAVWGGKQSAPIFIKLLNSDPGLSAKPELIKILGRFPTAQTAEAVAPWITDFHVGREAVAVMRKIGPPGEPALLKVAATTDPEMAYTAIVLLGEVGSPASYKLLRQGKASRNLEVRQAATAALEAIKARHPTPTEIKP